METSQPTSPLAHYRQLAPSAAVRVSPLCLGTMTFGETRKERYGQITKDVAFAIMDHFYNAGGNFFDTADGYQDGQSEEWIGQWLAASNNRDEIVLATKYTTGSPSAGKIKVNRGGNNSKSMKLAIEASLRRLQTTYIDLYYVHWWDWTTSIPELMHGLNDLISAGKVLYLGISDTPAWIVAKANQYARDHGLRQFSVYQGMWNASLRDFEREIIPMVRDEGMALAPYGVLNQGRFQTQQVFKEREAGHEGRNFIPTSTKDKQVSLHLENISERKGCSLLNVALSYVLHKNPYVFPIVGGRKVEHIQGSIEALSVNLTDEEVLDVEKGYHFDHGFPHTFLTGTMFSPHDKPRAAMKPDDVWLTKNFGTLEWVQPPKPIGTKPLP